MVRDAEPADVEPLADVWFAAWRDAHLGLVPAELAGARTRASFRDRIDEGLAELRVVGPPGAPVGFHRLDGDELNQIFVAARVRGAGVAAALLADAEARLAARGVTLAFLECAIGNHRAARFYEKHGWHRARSVVTELKTPERTFSLEVWRYEKALTAPPATME